LNGLLQETPPDKPAFGLRVRSDIPEEVLHLMDYYPQPVRRQPAVEYLPEHRHAKQPTGQTGD
jgi:hypothetical protein